MALDVTTPESPGWWMHRLNRQLQFRNRQLRLLDLYYTGNPPLPAPENAKRSFQAVAKKARTNFAELIIDAVLDRMRMRAIRTAVETDQNGDAVAWKIHRYNGLLLGAMDVHQWMLTFGVAYTIVGKPDEDPDAEGVPVITAEDPRQVITEHDPMRPQLVRAAMKLYHDDALDLDVGYLYLAGADGGPVRVFRATKARRTLNPDAAVPFSPGSWDWDLQAGGEEGQEWTLTKRVPVARFLNRNGTGEFASHTDVLDRINHMILQRMVIATLQAFRQRAIKGLPVTYPEDYPVAELRGQEVDYDEMFAADPGALWQLPESAEMWESGQVDLGPILNATKDDVLHLAAVTRTPLPMFTPDAVTQSAEGASAAREGLVFKVEDRDLRAEDGWVLTYALAFEVMGDLERAKIHEIGVDWAPAERFSLTERASAAVQAKAAGVPWETRQADIWQYTPAEIERQKSERSDDNLLEMAMLTQQAAAQAPANAAAAG